LVPLYYLHRFQLEAAGKALGGLNYSYALRTGDTAAPYAVISPAAQKRTLDMILKSLKPEFLALPERILNMIPPKAYSYRRTRESFPRHTGKTFDAMALSEAAASHVMRILLHPQRAARIYEYNARNGQNVSLEDYMDRISDRVMGGKSLTGLQGALHRRVGHVFLHSLMMLDQNKSASAAVRSVAHMKLIDLEIWLRKKAKKSSGNKQYRTQYRYQADRIKAYLAGNLKVERSDLAAMPPGSPI